MKLKLNGPAVISIIYLVFGFLWILVSDKLLLLITRDLDFYHKVQNYKGLLFIVITTVIIFVLMQIYERMRNKAYKALDRQREHYQILSGLLSDLTGTYILGENKQLIPDWHSGPYERTIGYSFEELNKQGGFLSIVHPSEKEAVGKIWNDILEQKPSNAQIRLLHKSGHDVWVLFKCEIAQDIYSPKITQVFFAMQDISQIKTTEIELLAGLKEKEFLLKEIHHRVKNNFQIIISLLKLTANNIKDPIVESTFKDSVSRIFSMALVHEKLYTTQDFSRVNLSDYLKTLLHELKFTYKSKANINILLNAYDIFIPIDKAVPCGLVLNELVTNSIKHAFSNHSGGEIFVELKNNDVNSFTISVRDNGKGGMELDKMEKSESIGLQLVQILTEQIDAALSVQSDASGTFVEITIPY